MKARRPVVADLPGVGSAVLLFGPEGVSAEGLDLGAEEAVACLAGQEPPEWCGVVKGLTLAVEMGMIRNSRQLGRVARRVGGGMLRRSLVARGTRRRAVLTVLSCDCFSLVRRPVAGNRRTPPPVLVRLANDPSSEVRGELLVSVPCRRFYRQDRLVQTQARRLPLTALVTLAGDAGPNCVRTRSGVIGAIRQRSIADAGRWLVACVDERGTWDLLDLAGRAYEYAEAEDLVRRLARWGDPRARAVAGQVLAEAGMEPEPQAGRRYASSGGTRARAGHMRVANRGRSE